MNLDEEDSEKEANYFAMCLLIPEELLRREIRSMGRVDLCNEKNIKKLADKFLVSPALMAFRIGQLTPT